jgi:hypothetical protein
MRRWQFRNIENVAASAGVPLKRGTARRDHKKTAKGVLQYYIVKVVVVENATGQAIS